MINIKRRRIINKAKKLNSSTVNRLLDFAEKALQSNVITLTKKERK